MWLVWLAFCDCGFHFVCPLLDKDKRLMGASWWERLTVGETGSCSDGAMLSKSLIQFSVDGWVCVPSLLFDLRPNYGGGNEDSGNLLLKVPCRHCCTQFPWPCTRPSLTSVSADPCLCQRLLDTHWQVWVKIIGGNILTKSFPWCWERLKGMTEDEKVGWHHQLDGHEFE